MGLKDSVATSLRSFADRVQGRAPMGEASTTGGPLYSKGILPYNPDDLARRKGGLKIYDQMRRDDQVKAIQSLRKRARLSTAWDIEPASDDERDQEIAEFVKSSLLDMKGTLKSRLYEVLSALDYGFSVTEKVWYIIPSGDYAGMVGLQALKTRKPHYWDFDTDEYDNLRPGGLLQDIASGGKPKHLDPGKFVIFTWNGEFGNWYGESDLRAAYRSWWSKEIIIRFWNVFLEKFGMPTVKATYNGNPEHKEILERIINDIQSRTGVVIPEGTAIELMEATRRGEASYETAVDKHDTAIARALLVPDKLGFTESPGGSYNLGQKHFDLFVMVQESLGDELCENVMDEQVIKQLVDYNFPNVEKYPKFKFEPLTEEAKNDLADRFTKAITAGIASTSRKKDVDHMRQALDLPEITDEEWEEEQEREAEEEEEAWRREQELARRQPGQPPKAPGKQYSTWNAPRALTEFEKRVDFAEVQKSLDSLEEDAAVNLGGIVERMRDRLLRDVEKDIRQGMKVRGVDRVQLKYVGEFRTAVASFLRSTYEDGAKDARGEVKKAAKAFAVTNPTGPVTPEDFFLAKAFTLAGTFRDKVLSDAKYVLYRHFRTGATMQETMFNLRTVFEGYLKARVTTDEELLTPYRLENIIRTNATEAYTEGRLASYRDPALDGYVVATQYSAILDGRETDYCRYLDQKVFEIGDPDLDRIFKPPGHFQCRSTLVPVLKGDKYTAITQEEKAKALGLKPKGM